MNKTTKTLGKILTAFIAIVMVCWGMSLLIIYNTGGHGTMANILGWLAVLFALLSILTLVSFLISLFFNLIKRNKKYA